MWKRSGPSTETGLTGEISGKHQKTCQAWQQTQPPTRVLCLHPSFLLHPQPWLCSVCSRNTHTHFHHSLLTKALSIHLSAFAADISAAVKRIHTHPTALYQKLYTYTMFDHKHGPSRAHGAFKARFSPVNGGRGGDDDGAGTGAGTGAGAGGGAGNPLSNPVGIAQSTSDPNDAPVTETVVVTIQPTTTLSKPVKPPGMLYVTQPIAEADWLSSHAHDSRDSIQASGHDHCSEHAHAPCRPRQPVVVVILHCSQHQHHAPGAYYSVQCPEHNSVCHCHHSHDHVFESNRDRSQRPCLGRLLLLHCL